MATELFEQASGLAYLGDRTIGLTSVDSSDSFGRRLRRIRGGDRTCVNELLRRWRPYIRSHARSLLKSHLARRVDSSDVVQDTLVRVHHRLSQFRGRTRQEWASWLKRILINEAKRTQRRHLADKRSVAVEDQRDSAAASESAADSQQSDNLILVERRARVMSALDQLPDPMHDVVVQRIFQRRPFRDIAQTIDRSESAARMLWSRGIRRLRQLLDSED